MSVAITLDTLPYADGSAQITARGISVLAAVSGPLEVLRRDELPDEATIDVSVRPSAGIAAVRERFFESLIHKTFKQVIKTNQHPRTLIQITLQIMASADEEAMNGRSSQAASMLHLLPPLLNAAMLALLGSSIPLLASFTSTVVVVSADGEIFSSPPVAQLQKAKSIHVMVYSSEGALILVESEGSFDIEILEACLASGRNECLSNQSGDVEMIDNEKVNMSKKFEQSVEARIKKSEQWRNGIKGSGS